MAERLQKYETSSSLLFVGLAVLVADSLVVFFLPSAFKVGRHGLFISIIGTLALAGLVLMITGFSLRRNTTEE
jgi:FtsH-binding integral membrane protein